MTKILVIEDEALFSSFIRQVISTQPDFQLVAESKSGFEGLRQAQTLKLDLVVLDIHLPDLSGLTVAKKLLQISPRTKILIVSASTSPIYIYNLVKLGVKGYMTKGFSKVEDFINALKIIRQGQEYFSEDAANALAFIIKQNEREFPLLSLSPQEIEVASQLIDGASIKVIAKAMHLSDKRIYRLRSEILTKLNAQTSEELTTKFWRFFTKS